MGKDSGRAGGSRDGTVSRSSMAVSIGHTSYSWSPPTTCATTPTGHTDFSWHVDTGTAGGDGLEGDLAELSAVLRAEKASVITVGRAARSKQHARFMPCPFSLALGCWTLCHCLSACPSRHLLVLSSIVSSAIYSLLLPQLQAAIADKENLMLMKAQLAQEKQEMAALQAALRSGQSRRGRSAETLAPPPRRRLRSPPRPRTPPRLVRSRCPRERRARGAPPSEPRCG